VVWRVGKLLADEPLMVQMLVADGAMDGKYGQAMTIYSDIQQASAKAKDGVLQRLALAIALEHAVPVSQTNPGTDTEAPATVDPVKRYLHFEKAFLAGELDPAFKNLSVWDFRFVVDGDEPDAILAWGRAGRDPGLGARDAAQLSPRPRYHARLQVALRGGGQDRDPVRFAVQQVRQA